MGSLDLARVEIRGGPLVLATHEDVDALERDLGLTLPDGYREYVTQLGDGTLNLLVRVLPPDRIRSGLDEHQGRMAAYWFWGDGRDGIDQQWAMGSIAITDTLDGDTLVVHPSSPGRIVVLPRDHERVFTRDHGLLEAIEWVCSGRVLRHFGPKRYFEPSERQHEVPGRNPARAHPPSTSRDEPAATDARAHLLAWFEAQREVEEWVVRASGGDPARYFSGDRPPDLDERAEQEASLRMRRVHTRFCAESMATSLDGSYVLTWPPRHDPTQFAIRDERTSAGGVAVFQVAEDITPGSGAQIVEYRLAPLDAGWQIISTRRLDWEDDPNASPVEEAEDDAGHLAPAVPLPALRSGPTPPTPREHLLEWFAAQYDLEEWLERVHRPGIRDRVRSDIDTFDPIATRLALDRLEITHARYCTSKLASTLLHDLRIELPSPHHPDRFRIREEAPSRGRIAIRVAERVQPGQHAQVTEYRLASEGEGWRVASIIDREPEDTPTPRTSLLSRLLGRRD